jgi:hypothetical protein
METKPDTSRWSDEECRLLARLQAGETVVLNRSRNGPHWNLWRWAEEEGLAVYIGRADRFGRWPGSKWANPFRKGKRGEPPDQEMVCDLYEQEHWPRRPDLEAEVHTLRGKALGCWCAPELRCHGDFLKRKAEE